MLKKELRPVEKVTTDKSREALSKKETGIIEKFR